jgi:hypothetical protein
MFRAYAALEAPLFHAGKRLDSVPDRIAALIERSLK